jgi:hypothetical protein
MKKSLKLYDVLCDYVHSNSGALATLTQKDDTDSTILTLRSRPEFRNDWLSDAFYPFAGLTALVTLLRLYDNIIAENIKKIIDKKIDEIDEGILLIVKSKRALSGL